MRKSFISIALFLMCIFVATSCRFCGQNTSTKQYGGSIEILLPRGSELKNITWKGDNLWYLTTDRPSGVEPKTYTFKERSNYGISEGKVVIKEQ